jgi:tRNA threonylcarbamoyladenosine biosynthesis protein TsaB
VKLLALDTATELCSAALLHEDELLVREELIGRGHAERLLPMVESLLAEAGLVIGALDALAVGRGPGTFTGVRVAVAMAQGLAMGADLPVVPVSDLAALAAAALRRDAAHPVLACLDARMNELYWGLYGLDQATVGAVDPWQPGFARVVEHLSAPAAVSLPEGLRCTVAGSGWAVDSALATRYERQVALALPALLPSAREIARLAAVGLANGDAVSASALAPVYLRDDVATPSTRPPGGPRPR